MSAKKIIITFELTLMMAVIAGCGEATPADTPTSTPSDTITPTPLGGGGRIAFVSKRDGNSEIYTMESDGANIVRLINNSAGDEVPAWSPDGKRIAFTSSRGDSNPADCGRNCQHDIFVMQADGSGVVRLTNGPSINGGNSWAPDGKRIAFGSNRDSNEEIYVMNADGSNPVRLTDNSEGDYWPVWSPDGTRIAFVSGRDGNQEIYVMNTDGSDAVNLTGNAGWNYFPAWSPDGTRIAFASNRDGNLEIYLMNADGSNGVRLTDNPADDSFPSWSPDGTRIVFQSQRDGNPEIYMMGADGSKPVRITNNPADDGFPAWQPSMTITLTQTISPAPTSTSTPTHTPTFTATPELLISAKNAVDLIHLESLRYGNGITNINFTPSDDVALFNSNDKMIRVMDLAGNIKNTIGPLSTSHGWKYNMLKVSKDGLRVAVAETYYIPPVKNWPYNWYVTVYIRSLQDDSFQRDVGLPAGISAISDDFNTIALFLNNYGYTGNVQIWRLMGDKYKKTQDIPASGRDYMVLSADGSIVATDYLGSILVWNTKDGTRVNTLSGAGAPRVFSDDSSFLASQTDKVIKIWRLENNTLLQSIPYSGEINKVVFSQNSQIVAAAIGSNILIWNVIDGTLIKTITGKDSINAIAFSPDGKLLAFNQSKTIEIWGIATDGFNLATEIPTIAPIKIGDYSIIIDNVRVGDVGWNPCGLSSNLALAVNVSEESGKLSEVGGLKVWFTDDQGNKLGESCQPTEIGTNLQGKQWLAWYVYISQPANGYFMHFPTGEVIDLSPLLP